MVKFVSVFKDEIMNFIAIRKAALSESGIKHDICYLASLDEYLAGIGVREKSITEQTMEGWVK